MTEEEIKALKLAGKWTICPPDPMLRKRTPYELFRGSRQGLKNIARNVAKQNVQKDLIKVQEKRSSRQIKSPQRGNHITAQQKETLHSLRVHVPKKCTRAHAARLINAALKLRKQSQT